MRQVKFRYWNGSKVLNQEAIINHLNKYIARNDKHLMQFTGLFDKQGVEIYEGDIVKFKVRIIGDRYEEENLSVIYKNGCFIIKNTHILSDWYMYCKVIGNIYQNPELLEPR